MAVAVAATAFPDSARADPRDEVDYVIDCSAMLEADEEIADYELLLPAEAVALGLEIMEGGGRDHALLEGDAASALALPDNVAILFWLTIDEAYRADAAFNVSSGVRLPIELTFTTTSVPPRTRQRTALLRIVQQ